MDAEIKFLTHLHLSEENKELNGNCILAINENRQIEFTKLFSIRPW